MDKKTKSIISMLVSTLAFSLMAVFVKAIGDISVFQKTIFRTGTITILSYIFILYFKQNLTSIKHHKLLLLRSTFGTFGILLNYYAIDHLILSDANVIFRLSTVFLIIFSWIFLKEKINITQTTMIIIAFTGVAFIIKPALSFEIIPALVAVLGAAFAAMAYTALRALGKKEHPVVIVFYFSVFTTIILFPYVITNIQPMTNLQIFFSIMAGLFAGIGQIGVTLAYKYAPAKEVSIYNYAGVVFTAVFSIFVFGATPDFFSIIGYLIVFASSYYMYLYNNKSSINIKNNE